MKKSLIASSIACVFTTSALPVFAQEKVIVVTANRVEQELTEILTDVEVIERDDIERLQPQSLVDLLVNVAGIDFAQTGGHGQDASVFVRGANSNQVLILIDGIRVGSATLGNKAVSSIPMAQIERVEIVKGPRAAIWGSDAIGGVIQIFTRRYDSGEHRTALTLGSNSTKEADVAIGFGNDTVSNTLSFSYKKSDGFDVRIDGETDDDGYDHQSVALRGDYKLSSNSIIDWVAQSDRGESLFDSPWNTPDQNVTEYNNHHWNLRYSHQGENWGQQIAFNASRDSSRGFETRRELISYLVNNQYSSEISFSGGLELYNDDVSKSSTQFAVDERQTQSAFVNVNYVGDVFLGEVAIRHDDVESVAGETTFNIGAGFKIESDHLLSFNYGEGFKAPTFNDLYFPFGGNPDLNFETSDNIEVVYKGFYESSNLTISVYDSDIKNLIQWAPDSNGIWSPQNVGEVEVSGIDVSYQFRYGDFNHKFTADKVDAENAATGTALIRRAENHFGYEVSYTNDKFDWFAQLQYVGERPDVDFQTFDAIKLDSFTRINLGVGYAATENIKLQLKVNDVGDEAPTIVSGYYPIEREVYLTVSYQELK